MAEALAMMKLAGFEDRKPRQLSGGQQQRVALARALVIQPKVLLLDEPFSALDKNLRASMQVEVKEIQRRLGVTTIFVTHDQSEALSLSDRIAVMSGGRICQIDTPEQLYRRPADRFVASFIGEGSLLRAQLEQIDGATAPIVRSGERRLRFRPSLSSASTPARWSTCSFGRSSCASSEADGAFRRDRSPPRSTRATMSISISMRRCRAARMSRCGSAHAKPQRRLAAMAPKICDRDRRRRCRRLPAAGR